MIARTSAALRTAPSAPPPAQRRQRLGQRCSAEAPGGPPLTPAQQQIREAMQARISKAREYKKGGQGQPPATGAAGAIPVPQPPPPAAAAAAAAGAPPAPPPASGQDVEQAFDQAAQQLAAKEEAKFLQAVSETSPSSSSSSGGTASSSSSSGGTSEAAASREAMLARIAAARSYKQQPGSGSPPATSPAATASPASVFPAAPRGTASPQAQPAPEQQQQLQQQQDEAEQQRSFRTGGGGAVQAANWLRFAEKPDRGDGGAAIDQNLSAEQFTLAKEAQKKQQRVEIITADASWAAQARQDRAAQQGQPGGEAGGSVIEEEKGEDLHKPKVATWGVFPRPRNISEAYGGGRTLRPGQALEPQEQAVEREERIKRSMQEYRKSLGLDVDPEVEAQAQALCDEGTALFDQGLISLALPKFAAASELMALRSRLGGEARLQQAICLDSLGQNQEAYDIYKNIQTHPAPGVAKKAKRMLFGWKAAESLKTKNLSYQPSTDQWRRYFDAVNQNAAYAPPPVRSGEEEEEGSGFLLAAVAVLVVILLPVGLVACRSMLP